MAWVEPYCVVFLLLQVQTPRWREGEGVKKAGKEETAWEMGRGNKGFIHTTVFHGKHLSSKTKLDVEERQKAVEKLGKTED